MFVFMIIFMRVYFQLTQSLILISFLLIFYLSLEVAFWGGCTLHRTVLNLWRSTWVRVLLASIEWNICRGTGDRVVSLTSRSPPKISLIPQQLHEDVPCCQWDDYFLLRRKMREEASSYWCLWLALWWAKSPNVRNFWGSIDRWRWSRCSPKLPIWGSWLSSTPNVRGCRPSFPSVPWAQIVQK